MLGDGATCTDNNDCQNGWCKDGKCADPNASYSVNAETCFIFPAGSPSKDNCFKVRSPRSIIILTECSAWLTGEIRLLQGTTTPSNLECDPTLLYCIGGRLGQGCNGDDFDCKWPGYCLNNVCTDTDPKVTFNLESGQRCATSLNCRSVSSDDRRSIFYSTQNAPSFHRNSATSIPKSVSEASSFHGLLVTRALTASNVIKRMARFCALTKCAPSLQLAPRATAIAVPSEQSATLVRQNTEESRRSLAIVADVNCLKQSWLTHLMLTGYCNPDKVCESYASRSLGASCKAKEQCEVS